MKESRNSFRGKQHKVRSGGHSYPFGVAVSVTVGGNMENLQAYGEFARVYDMFQDNVDYDAWGAWLKQQLKEYGILDGLVLDLGCGTGTMTELLAEAGYDMIGVESGHDILYLLQDMQEFELYGTVRAVVSVCDSLNYITEEEELQHVFALVNNYLDPRGIFLFDMNTVYKYQTMIGDATIAENREEGSFIWENSYDEESGINTYELALFLPREDGLYEKTEEVHYQRAYPLEKIKELIQNAGMELLAVYDAYTMEPPKKDSGRLTFVVREHGKEV